MNIISIIELANNVTRHDKNQNHICKNLDRLLD